MRKLFFLLFAVSLTLTQAQNKLLTDSWSLGFGLNSARMMGDTRNEKLNFGGHVFVQRDFSEYMGLRIRADYNNMTGTSYKFGFPPEITTNLFGIGGDFLFRFFNCQVLEPYIGAGFQVLYFKVENGTLPVGNTSRFGELSSNIFFGAYINDLIGEDWRLKGEFSNRTISTDLVDGELGGQGGIFGGSIDNYVQFDIGLQYFFDKGKPSKLCDNLPGGASTYAEDLKKSQEEMGKLDAKLDRVIRDLDNLQSKYDSKPSGDELGQIRDMVREALKEKTDVNVETYVDLGVVYFNTNQVKVRYDSYADLLKVARFMLNNPGAKLEVSGHTDNRGGDAANQKLSDNRANFVKDFLVAQGVDGSRLSTVGMASSRPVTDNKTEEARKLNRRVEFRLMK